MIYRVIMIVSGIGIAAEFIAMGWIYS